MNGDSRRLAVELERWPLREPFAIARHVFHDSLALTVELREGDAAGRGECEPHEHEQTVGLEAQAELLRRAREPGWVEGLDRTRITRQLPCLPLRNALDCALWDLEAKTRGVRAWQLDPVLAERVGEAPPVPLIPTVALDTPAAMADAAARHRGRARLKIKLGRRDGHDAERIEAVAAACPGTELLADVNGGWSRAQLIALLPLAARGGVTILEQPLPPGADGDLPRPPTGLRFCADESCTDRASLPQVAGRYQMINVKLDKTGGLGEALALVDEAARRGLPWMVGSNGGTSLAMAPLYLLAHGALCVDAGCAHLGRDREPRLDVRDGWLFPPPPALWG
jgi:L-alanine-DL-glutamate epimerase-like enolase superfamily enzyme